MLLLLVGLKGYSQDVINVADTSILSFKTYLEKNIRYPAIAAENDVKGQMLITFKLNNDKKITDVQFVIPLMAECDSAVIKAIRKYSQTLLLPPDEYTIGLHYILSVEGKPDSPVIPFDKKLYRNFLFEISMRHFLMKQKVYITY